MTESMLIDLHYVYNLLRSVASTISPSWDFKQQSKSLNCPLRRSPNLMKTFEGDLRKHSTSFKMSVLFDVLANLPSLEELDKATATFIANLALSEARQLAREVGDTGRMSEGTNDIWARSMNPEDIIETLEEYVRHIASRSDAGGRNSGLENSSGESSRQGALMGARNSSRVFQTLRDFFKSPTTTANQDQSLAQVKRVRQGDGKKETKKETGSMRECLICSDEFPLCQMITLECGHHYCQRSRKSLGCLGRTFQAATKSRSLYPPKCCTIEIPLERYRSRIDSKTVRKYEKQKIEWDTDNPIYCCNPKCGKYVPPENIRGKGARCHRCGVRTCIKCKRRAHREGDLGIPECDETDDAALQLTLKLMTAKQWRRCPKCRTGVEKSAGCEHMTFVSSILLWHYPYLLQMHLWSAVLLSLRFQVEGKLNLRLIPSQPVSPRISRRGELQNAY